MSEAVCLAARTPASRAVWRGSPLATSPRRINESAVGPISIAPRATASRLVTALSPTSTIRALPRASTCDNEALRSLSPAPCPLLLTRLISLREIEREALERHGEVHAFELHVGRDFQRTR